MAASLCENVIHLLLRLNVMRALYVWLGCLFGTSAAITIAYLWLDRPIARLVAENVHRQHYSILSTLARTPDPFLPLALIVFMVVGLWALACEPLSTGKTATIVCSVAVIVSEMFKDELKFIFGRTWPTTWIRDNPSFIRDGVYGFNFMHGGAGYHSFPSGHMAVACAVISVLWIWYPRLRWLYMIAAVSIAAGLVGANYHFLSDVLAGAFIGASVGLMTTAIWNASKVAGNRRQE